MFNQFNSNQVRADQQRRQDAERRARQMRFDKRGSARRQTSFASAFARVVSVFL